MFSKGVEEYHRITAYMTVGYLHYMNEYKYYFFINLQKSTFRSLRSSMLDVKY